MNSDQGEEEKIMSYNFVDHNRSLNVRGPIKDLKISGHNNRLYLNGHIYKIKLSGHNNRLEVASEAEDGDVLVELLEADGHNNTIIDVPTNRLKLNGHNNTISLINCQNLQVNGFHNKVYNNGHIVQSSHTGHATGSSHANAGRHGHAANSFSQNVNINGHNIHHSVNVDFEGLGENVNTYVQNILSQFGLSIGNNQGDSDAEEEVADEGDIEGGEYVEVYEDQEIPQEVEEPVEELTQEQWQEIVNSYPVHKYTAKIKADTCSICLDKFKIAQDVRTLGCAHTFHKNCVDSWLASNLSCPLCRSPLQE